ncbi:MAG TPA: hypothetical protein VHR42_10270 [Clostridia bacterium]|nr:hypothetical protein [Clostridia bacterium]
MKKTSLLRSFLRFGLPVCLVSFSLLLIGIRFAAGNQMNSKIILSCFILSLIFGAVSFALFRFRIWMLCFWAGLAIGFFDMFRIFIDGMEGWGDLIGLFSLFIWAIAGILGGAAAQLLRFLLRKFTGRRTRRE